MNAPNYTDLANHMEDDAIKDRVYAEWILLGNSPHGFVKNKGTYAHTASKLMKNFPSKFASQTYLSAPCTNMSKIQSRALDLVRKRLKKSQDGTGLTAIMAGLHINNDEVSDVSMAQTDTDDMSAMSLETTINKTTAAKAVGQGRRGRMQTIAEDALSKDDLLHFLEQGLMIQQDKHMTREQKTALLHSIAADMVNTKAVGERIQKVFVDLEKWTKEIEDAQPGPDRNAAIKGKQEKINTMLSYGWQY